MSTNGGFEAFAEFFHKTSLDTVFFVSGQAPELCSGQGDSVLHGRHLTGLFVEREISREQREMISLVA